MQKPSGEIASRRRVLSAEELREAILAELVTLGFNDGVSSEHLQLCGGGREWHATLRPNGIRLDESRAAAIASISRRLASGYDLASN
jgi:hypothetical protein